MWLDKAQTTCESLKPTMSSLATVTLPNFDSTFDITTDPQVLPLVLSCPKMTNQLLSIEKNVPSNAKLISIRL